MDAVDGNWRTCAAQVRQSPPDPAMLAESEVEPSDSATEYVFVSHRFP